MSRLQKKNILTSQLECDKQVYHEFDPISADARSFRDGSLIKPVNAAYDIH